MHRVARPSRGPAGRLPQPGGRGAHTAYAAAQALPWTRRGRRFAELDPFNQMLAIFETGVHLDLLAAQGRLARTVTPDLVT